MDWTNFDFLAAPWFVIPWYAVGVAGAIGVGYDIATRNTPLKTAMKWAWPIIIVFFSVIGLGLYLATARPPGIGRMRDPEQKKAAFDRYELSMVRRVNGAVIHCVAGDGLGVMTAMVIARAVRMNFWAEFWFEYGVGFLFGWLIFQLKSMSMMTDNRAKALGMAFRGEFFSMLTVMAGMGAVMSYVTALAVTAQPRPLTFAFWGFGALGLFVGYVATFPMNWMMVMVGWKHGMGSKSGARRVQTRGAKLALVGTMCVLGSLALTVPGLLTVAREHQVVPAHRGDASATDGLEATLQDALRAEEANNREQAVTALDAAHRAADVLAHNDPGLVEVRDDLKRARRAIWMGDHGTAQREIAMAAQAASSARPHTVSVTAPSRFDGATLLDSYGNEIGELDHVDAAGAHLALGGVRNFWGFLDLGATREVTVPVDALTYGPARSVGWSYVTYPGAPRTSSL